MWSWSYISKKFSISLNIRITKNLKDFDVTCMFMCYRQVSSQAQKFFYSYECNYYNIIQVEYKKICNPRNKAKFRFWKCLDFRNMGPQNVVSIQYMVYIASRKVIDLINCYTAP